MKSEKRKQFISWFNEMLEHSHFCDHYKNFEGILPIIFPVECDQVPVMAVGRAEDKVYLFINRNAIESNRQYKNCFRGILLHELLHVALGHTEKRFKRKKSEELELASEFSVNELIEDKMPDDCILIEDFLNVIPGLEKYQSTMERYELIKKWKEKERDKFNSLFENEKLIKIRMEKVINKLIEEMKNDATINNECNESFQDIIENIVNKNIIKTQELSEETEDKIRVGEIHAKEEMTIHREKDVENSFNIEIKKFIQKKMKFNSKIKYCLRKPNRRFPEMVGIVAGKRMLKSDFEVFVGIDTSGSMSNDEFILIERELRGIRRIVKKVTIVECDAEFCRSYEFTGELSSITGRGGTNLSDVFSVKRKISPGSNCIIIFTDGFIDTIDNREYEMDTLWVITKHDGLESLNAAAPFGMKIVLNDALMME